MHVTMVNDINNYHQLTNEYPSNLSLLALFRTEKVVHDSDLSIVFLFSCKTRWETTGERVLLTFNRVTLLNALTSLYVWKVNCVATRAEITKFKSSQLYLPTDPSGISYKQVIDVKMK